MFSELPWHDAILTSIYIDRQNPGFIDEVSIKITWPDSSEAKLTFTKVYQFSCTLNFGIIADESIFSGDLIAPDDPDFIILKRTWEKFEIGIEDIVGYVITTSSTASVIKIFAKSFNMESLVQEK